MAASRKHDKSSKTAHVLNLITSPAQKQVAQETPETEETTSAAPPETSAETSTAAPSAAPAAPAATPAIPAILSPHTLTQPVMPDAHSEQALSDQIRQALEVELTKPEPTPTPPPKPAPKAKPAPAPVMPPQPEPIPAMAQQPAPAPAMAQQPAPAPVMPPQPEPIPAMSQQPAPAPAMPPQPAPIPAMAQQPAPAPAMPQQPAPAPVMPPQPAPAPAMQQPEPQPVEASAPSEDDLMYVNIMQKMVEDKASRYIKMLGLCTCPQCTMDVKALALSNLVPKYAVTPKQIPIPMLTIYEQRYGNIVSTQLMNACKTVMKKPRHHV